MARCASQEALASLATRAEGDDVRCWRILSEEGDRAGEPVGADGAGQGVPRGDVAERMAVDLALGVEATMCES